MSWLWYLGSDLITFHLRERERERVFTVRNLGTDWSRGEESGHTPRITVGQTDRAGLALSSLQYWTGPSWYSLTTRNFNIYNIHQT